MFEVDPWADAPPAAVRVPALGRFLHEAVAVDPVTGVVYLTEDNGYDSGLYRFRPDAPGRLAEGGVLEMLAVADRPEYDTSYDQVPGVRLPVRWVPINDPDPSSAGTDSSAVFHQGLSGGGARFKRAEGCALVGDQWFVAVTEGGDAGLGQVWAYDVAAGEIRLVYEPAAPADMFGPDGLTRSPSSAGVLVTEDNGNGDPNRLHLLGPDGRLVTFAQNLADTSELSGVCWSPDGTTLFANLYGDEAAGIARSNGGDLGTVVGAGGVIRCRFQVGDGSKQIIRWARGWPHGPQLTVRSDASRPIRRNASGRWCQGLRSAYVVIPPGSWVRGRAGSSSFGHS